MYLLGASNSGKSSLFNKLKVSDYCEPLASLALKQATVSHYLNTTLDFIKFPIQKLNERSLHIRNKRIQEQKKFEYEKNLSRYEYCKNNLSKLNLFDICKYLTAYEYVYNTFKNSITWNIAPDLKHDEIERTKVIRSFARNKFKIKSMDSLNFVYDTPGVMNYGECLM